VPFTSTALGTGLLRSFTDVIEPTQLYRHIDSGTDEKRFFRLRNKVRMLSHEHTWPRTAAAAPGAQPRSLTPSRHPSCSLRRAIMSRNNAADEFSLLTLIAHSRQARAPLMCSVAANSRAVGAVVKQHAEGGADVPNQLFLAPGAQVMCTAKIAIGAG